MVKKWISKMLRKKNINFLDIYFRLKGILNCECPPGEDRKPNDNQTTCCDEYKLNGSLRYNHSSPKLSQTELTKIQKNTLHIVWVLASSLSHCLIVYLFLFFFRCSFEMMKNVIESMNVTKAPEIKKSEETPMHVNILILGGGLAGLGAATAISNSKTKFTYKILEAQQEAGGRVKSVNLINYYFNKKSNCLANEVNTEKRMDAGAQWLHGRYNPLYTIAEKYDLLTDDQSDEGLGAFLYEGGRQIDEFFVKKIDFQMGKLLTICEEFAQTAKSHKLKPKPKTKNKLLPKSVGHFLRDNFQKFINNEIDNQNDKECAKDLFDWHKRFQIIDNSCLSLDQLSAKYWGKYSFNGESCQAHYNFENGFTSCVDAILNELADIGGKDSIHFNKHVIEIQINDKNCNQRSLKSLNLINNVEKKWKKLANISVKCADGSSYTADHVLVTFPLGILKKTHQQLFKPGLPQRMRLAIDSLGYETINKIFLEFNAPWWNDLDGIQFIYEVTGEENHKDNQVTFLSIPFLIP